RRERLRRLLRHHARVHRRAQPGREARRHLRRHPGGPSLSLVPTFRPRIQMLSKEMIDRIIDEAFDVLGTIGLQFEHPKALALLGEHGQRIDKASERAWLSRDFIEKAIQTAPKSFKIWNVTGDASIEVGGDTVTYDPGSAAIKMLETDGHTRPSTSADYIRLSRVVQQLPHIRAAST